VTILDHPEAQTLLADATLDEAQLVRLAAGLGPFLDRYAPCFQRAEQRRHLRLILDGKLSSLTRKTCEPIAHHLGVRRENLQDFVGSSPWDDDAVLAELRRHVVEEWADPDGVIALDGSGFPKKGEHSCGVQRQYCGRLGKVENCQVGVFLGYACASGHTLLDRRLYLPEDWAGDAGRREKAHVPEGVAFQEGWRIALGLLARCQEVPHGWVTADDELGRVQGFRAELREAGERYLVDVPCNTLVRDLEEAPPIQARRRGSQPKAPLETAASWAGRQPATRWRWVEVRAGEKGPIRVEAMTVRVHTTLDGSRLGPEERLVVRRAEGGELSYHLSNAGDEVGLEEMVRAKGKHHEVEQCFAEAKGEVGLGHYEVRSWVGWHHHMTLSLLALWFLTHSRWQERGEKSGAERERGARGVGPGLGAARVDAAGGAARTQRHAPAQGGGPHLPLVPPHRMLSTQTRARCA
jgi:SRSO17 transposase